MKLLGFPTVDDRDAAVVETFVREKHSLRSIKSAFALSPQMIRNIIQAAGVAASFGRKRAQLPRIEKAYAERRAIAGSAKALFEKGMFAIDIAKKLEVPRRKILITLKEEGCVLSWRGPKSVNSKTVIALSKGGFSFSEIIAETGLSPSHVGVIRHKYGLTKPRQPRNRLSYWPYLAAVPRPSDGADIIARVNAIVPKNIPDHARADICQELILRVLDGRVPLNDLEKNFDAVRKDFNKLHPGWWGPRSLDQPVWDGDRRLHDVLGAPDISLWDRVG